MKKNIGGRHMESSSSDKRRHERKTYGAYVDVTVDSLTYIALLKNLSLSGAFIAAAHLPTIENEKTVSLSIPYEDKPGTITLNGTVRRVTENGIGIEFF
jgi:hypothetical protein